VIFSTTSDTEVILHLIARMDHSLDIAERVKMALHKVNGAYSLALLNNEKIIAVRDPAGVRPLSIGKIGEGYVVASETCAFDLIGAEFVRDVEPGELIEIDRESGEITSHSLTKTLESSFCVFEYIYFSRPDSSVIGKNVYQVRTELGRQLAIEHQIAGDIVIPVPDSGVPAALGYANESKVPFEFGLIRNHYIGRTFIEPKQSIRDFGVKIKLNPNTKLLRGKDVVVVDDSIVRGTTSKKIVKMLKESGARKVHFMVSSPPTISSCYYGIDTPSTEELIASKYTIEETRKYLEVDTLGYLSLEGLYNAIGRVSGAGSKGYCDACFSKNYCLGMPEKGKGKKSIDAVQYLNRFN